MGKTKNRTLRHWTGEMAIAALSVSVMGCSQQRTVTSVERNRILIDCSFDKDIPEEANDFIAPYKLAVDSLMSPVVGQTARYMTAQAPEGLLSNLLTDILVWAGDKYGETPDFAIYNMGGIRAALAKGDVTIGNILDVAPFENRICFVSMKGDKVTELFTQIAAKGGEGARHEVKLRVSKDGELISALVDGKAIDPERTYRIATIDYVAQGNDKMVAFKYATDVNSPNGSKDNVREVIMEYFRNMTAQGKVVDSNIEGRIIIE